MFRKTLSAVGLVLGIVGFAAFLTILVRVWVVKRVADRQLAEAVEKAHHAGDAGARMIALVRQVISRANESLAAARSESANSRPGGKEDPLVRMAMRKAHRELPNEVGRAREAVEVASEVVVVFGAALDVFSEHPMDRSELGVKPRDMQMVRTQLDSASAELSKVRSVLGITLEGATAEQLSQVDQALSMASQMTDRCALTLDEARNRIDEVEQEARAWTRQTALAITALSALAALGQVFLVRACWRGLVMR